jgi:RND family efflux transporter MFP subunit
MVQHRFLLLVLSLPAIVCSASCGPDAAAATAAPQHSHDPTSNTVFGDRLLLYLEYPHLVRGTSARFLAHLTVLADGEPVRAGNVALEIGSTRLAVDAAKRDGLFIPEGALPEAGTFEARLVVQSAQATETLQLGSIVVHPNDAGANAAAHAAEGPEPPNAVPFLMEAQWKVKLLVAEATTRHLSERLSVPARAVAPEGMSAVVSASIGGRLQAPASGALPRTGERVAAGQTLGFVEPPLGAADLAQLRALDLEFDLKALDVLRTTAEAEARLRFAERERERIARLRGEGLSTQQQFEQAEQSVALARAELDAAGRTQKSLDRLVATRGDASGGARGSAVRLALDAPIAGSVVEVLGVPGASVEPGAPLLRILDGSRVWIEGRVSEFDLAQVGSAPTAVARFAALPSRSFELRGASAGKPYLGQEVDPASRTLLVRYELDNADGAVRPGMLAELLIATGEREAAVAIPAEAVLMDQGIPTAYVMLEGELFQKRDLELGLRDGEWVEVKRGIERGEHVATRGAYIVKLAALSPASFGPGHAH